MEADDPTKSETKLPKRITNFYDHLDVCKQCADNPFALCVEGAKLLREAATK